MNVGVVDRPIPPRQIATLTHCQEHHQLRYSALMCHQFSELILEEMCGS